MKLIPDWRVVLKKAWSLRLMLVAAILSAAEFLLPFYSDSMPQGMFAGMSFVTVAGAFIARFIAQKGLHNEP